MSEKKKTISALDEIRWAKDNLAGAKSKAPSEFAVLMRDRMKESKEFFDKFIFTFYPKLLPKDAGDEIGGGAADGTMVVDIIERVLRSRDSAIGSTSGSLPGNASSNLASATMGGE